MRDPTARLRLRRRCATPRASANGTTELVTMPRTILMGDPTYFSVLGGANPHTRNVLGVRKSVNADRARAQWHGLARALIAHGTEVCVIEPHERMSGLVYPANAGFLYPLASEPGDA